MTDSGQMSLGGVEKDANVKGIESRVAAGGSRRPVDGGGDRGGGRRASVKRGKLCAVAVREGGSTWTRGNDGGGAD